jgi:hypothetical protein
MIKTNLGRVQGGSIFTCNTESTTNINLNTLAPTDIKPMIGDSVLFSNGDLRKITNIEENNAVCSQIITSLKGVSGQDGVNLVNISAGNSSIDGEYTVTPINFLLSDGTTLSTNARAKAGVSPTMTYNTTTKTLTITRG